MSGLEFLTFFFFFDGQDASPCMNQANIYPPERFSTRQTDNTQNKPPQFFFLKRANRESPALPNPPSVCTLDHFRYALFLA